MKSARCRVADGVTYICFFYENSEDKKETGLYCLLNDPSNNNYIKLALPDGSKITEGGKNLQSGE